MTADEFLAYFSEERFIKNLSARSKDGVLSEMSMVLAGDSDIRDPGLLLEMIRRRENLGSTGIGQGIAVPHGRSTAVTRTKVVFARSKRGVEFGAPDRNPCMLFFLIVAPYEDHKQEYLPLLGKIVETVGNPTTRERLLQISTHGEFQAVIREALGG